MLLEQLLSLGDLLRLEAEAYCQFHCRLDPEFRFAIGILNMDVGPPLLTGKEVEPEPFDPQNCWTHGASIARTQAGGQVRLN